ncbi:MAG: hypothetical protein VYB74_02230, partial [Cyanobacteriota bacterium]|nr:hypothetical protein [Cyanobacteriota bacterium]
LATRKAPELGPNISAILSPRFASLPSDRRVLLILSRLVQIPCWTRGGSAVGRRQGARARERYVMESIDNDS